MSQKEASSASSRYAACDWYHHVPSKPNEKKSEAVLSPTSQIPGLSDLAEPHNELGSESRKWIKDTDSEYVKLAKQGGQPDLLKHTPFASKKTAALSYGPPDWYTDESLIPPPELAAAPLRNVPDYMIHEQIDTEQSEQQYKAKKGPFDFDQKNIWQRDYEKNEEEADKKVKLPAIKHDNILAAAGLGPATETIHDRPGKKCFFPPMPGDKNDAVNFSKLLSNGYGDDWIDQHGEQEGKASHKSRTTKGMKVPK